MTNQLAALDRVFHALGDPTRRAVLARLSQGSASVTDLAAPFPMALPSFVQHLRVLEKSGLIGSTKKGRVRTCHIKSQALSQAESWIATQRCLWEKRLDQFDTFVKTIASKETHDG
jgi:DNA-binding transcriptional ArsR family regulator